MAYTDSDALLAQILPLLSFRLPVYLQRFQFRKEVFFILSRL
jgi:hypothetical protein